MQVIHFTHGASDPLLSFQATATHWGPLVDGYGGNHVGCVHLEAGARIPKPSLTHAATLRVVHGRMTVMTEHEARIEILAGVGAVLERHEPYSITSDIGALVLVVESDTLRANIRGVSTPQRIAGQTWPSDPLL
jgi:hypothetical protein